MANREKFVNDAYTYLNGGINNSVTTVTVDDGTVFPSVGNYRVRVDDEVMLVTSRTGNDLTVVRGSSPASHSDGALIIAVLTEESFEQALKDHRLYADTIGSAHRISDVSGVYQTVSSLTAGGVAATWADSLGAFIVDGGANFSARFYSAPSTPWTFTVGFNMRIWQNLTGTNGFPQAGIIMKNTLNARTLKFIQYQRQLSTSQSKVYNAQVAQMNTFDSFSSSPSNHAWQTWGKTINWLRVTDNGTNLIFYQSVDGINWYQQYSQGRTSWLPGGPDQVGVGIAPAGSTIATFSEFLHLSFS